MSRDDAQTYCNDLGAELVKITSAEENDFVLALARKDAAVRARVWIGIEWSSSANGYFWSDFSAPVYTNWGQLHGNENCVVMWTNVSPLYASGYWNDRPCEILPNYLAGIVCKRLP